MAHFDETSGVVPCETPFGRWWQTMEEVNIEIKSTEPLSIKEVKCNIKSGSIECTIRGERILEVSASYCLVPLDLFNFCLVFKGSLYQTIQADESTWTLGSYILKFPFLIVNDAFHRRCKIHSDPSCQIKKRRGKLLAKSISQWTVST